MKIDVKIAAQVMSSAIRTRDILTRDQFINVYGTGAVAEFAALAYDITKETVA